MRRRPTLACVGGERADPPPQIVVDSVSPPAELVDHGDRTARRVIFHAGGMQWIARSEAQSVGLRGHPAEGVELPPGGAAERVGGGDEVAGSVVDKPRDGRLRGGVGPRTAGGDLPVHRVEDEERPATQAVDRDHGIARGVEDGGLRSFRSVRYRHGVADLVVGKTRAAAERIGRRRQKAARVVDPRRHGPCERARRAIGIGQDRADLAAECVVDMLGGEADVALARTARADLKAEIAHLVVDEPFHERAERAGAVGVGGGLRNLSAESVVGEGRGEPAGVGDGGEIPVGVVDERRHRPAERAGAIGVGLRLLRLAAEGVVFEVSRPGRVACGHARLTGERRRHEEDIAAGVVANGRGGGHERSRTVGIGPRLPHCAAERVAGGGRRCAGLIDRGHHAAAAIHPQPGGRAVGKQCGHQPVAGVVDKAGDAAQGVGLGGLVARRVVRDERERAVGRRAFYLPLTPVICRANHAAVALRC